MAAANRHQQLGRLRRLARLEHKDPGRYRQIADELVQMGRSGDAVSCYQRYLEQEPKDFSAHANLGYALADSGDREQALNSYRRALELRPDSPGLLTSLGVLLKRSGRLEEAKKCFENTLELAPDNADGHFQLADTLARCHQREQSMTEFGLALAGYRLLLEQQQNPLTLVKLAETLIWLERPGEALPRYRQVAAAAPGHPLVQYHAGLGLSSLQKPQEAISCFRRVAKLEPDNNANLELLAHTLRNAGETQQAIRYYQQLIQRHPNDAMAAFWLASLRDGHAPAVPPQGYVEHLFDDYASSFEEHLLGALRYRAPELLRDAVGRVSQLSQAHWSVIDLGCGTGLCGPLFRSLARHLMGVDLSARMLEQARERKVYDQLLRGDLITALQHKPAEFDLVIAADVFVYIGDLGPVFDAVIASLRPAGLFAFTVEIGSGTGYTLAGTGRYRHSSATIDSLADARGIELALRQQITPRLEHGQPVRGELYVLRGVP